MIATTQHGALYILAITAAATVATELIMWLWAYRSPSFRSVKVQHTLLLMPLGACVRRLVRNESLGDLRQDPAAAVLCRRVTAGPDATCAAAHSAWQVAASKLLRKRALKGWAKTAFCFYAFLHTACVFCCSHWPTELWRGARRRWRSRRGSWT